MLQLLTSGLVLGFGLGFGHVLGAHAGHKTLAVLDGTTERALALLGNVEFGKHLDKIRSLGRDEKRASAAA